MGSIEALARSESEGSKGVSVPYTADCPVYEVLYDSQGNPYFAATGEFTKGMVIHARQAVVPVLPNRHVFNFNRVTNFRTVF